MIEKEEEIDKYDHQSLTTHSKKRKNKKDEHSLKKRKYFRKRTSHSSDVSVVLGYFANECPNKEEWKDDMIKQHQSIMKNDVWI